MKARVRRSMSKLCRLPATWNCCMSWMAAEPVKAAAQRGEAEAGELDAMRVGGDGGIERDAGEMGRALVDADIAGVDVGGDEVVVVLAEGGVAADFDDALGARGDFEQAADLVEGEGGVELHVAGLVLLFERALGFDVAGAEVDAGALNVDGSCRRPRR